ERRHAGARVDQGGQLAEALAAADLDRGDLGDAGAVARRATGGLQVHDRERDLAQVDLQRVGRRQLQDRLVVPRVRHAGTLTVRCDTWSRRDVDAHRPRRPSSPASRMNAFTSNRSTLLTSAGSVRYRLRALVS